MRILVLNGSPKKKSDTFRLTEAFLRGMNRRAEHETHIVRVIDTKISPCRGCFSCWRRGDGRCVIDDDQNAILDVYRDADVIIWSFPLYCYGMPAPLKAIIDRILPLSKMTMEKVGDRYEHVGQADYSHLRYVMICGCGFPNSKQNFEPAVSQFKLLFPNGHTILTVPESPMFNVPQAAVVTVPRLEQVKEAGRQYAATGTIDEALIAAICSPMIPEEQYAAIVNAGA